MSAMASQITGVSIVAQPFVQAHIASLAFVRGIHRGPVDSPHIGPVTLKMFPFDDVIIKVYMYVIFYITTHGAKEMF